MPQNDPERASESQGARPEHHKTVLVGALEPMSPTKQSFRLEEKKELSKAVQQKLSNPVSIRLLTGQMDYSRASKVESPNTQEGVFRVRNAQKSVARPSRMCNLRKHQRGLKTMRSLRSTTEFTKRSNCQT